MIRSDEEMTSSSETLEKRLIFDGANTNSGSVDLVYRQYDIDRLIKERILCCSEIETIALKAAKEWSKGENNG